MKSSAQPPGVSTGNISGGNFTIINNTGAAATITIGASSKMGGKKAISQLREEVAAIQDLLIGSYKQHLEFAEYADLTKEALLKIIELMEQKVENQQIDDQYLRTVAQEAVINALRAKQVEPSILRRLVGNGVSQSLIASVIFEAIKAAPDIMALLG